MNWGMRIQTILFGNLNVHSAALLVNIGKSLENKKYFFTNIYIKKYNRLLLKASFYKRKMLFLRLFSIESSILFGYHTVK